MKSTVASSGKILCSNSLAHYPVYTQHVASELLMALLQIEAPCLVELVLSASPFNSMYINHTQKHSHIHQSHTAIEFVNVSLCCIYLKN